MEKVKRVNKTRLRVSVLEVFPIFLLQASFIDVRIHNLFLQILKWNSKLCIATVILKIGHSFNKIEDCTFLQQN